MHSTFNRRTATKVRNGRVRRKNHHRPTGHEGYVFDRESPGRGFRHVVTKRDLQLFIDIIPEWDRFSERLERIGLGSHSARGDRSDGVHIFYYREETGAIWLNAWPEDLWMGISSSYFNSHEDILERLGVSYDRLEDGVMCRFTEAQARAFMLLHVFMHELGHHFDRINQKHLRSTKGEDYAERFATSRFSQLFPEYLRIFGDPARAA